MSGELTVQARADEAEALLADLDLTGEQHSARPIRFYGLTPVPYVAAWEKETTPAVVTTDPPLLGSAAVRLVVRNHPGSVLRVAWADEQPGDRDAHDVLWMRNPIAPGVGRPQLGVTHCARQRRAAQRELCQMALALLKHRPPLPAPTSSRPLGLRTVALAFAAVGFRADLASVPGIGTRARLHLPAAAVEQPPPAPAAEPGTPPAPTAIS